ncbi:MAG: hypothetical protein K5661_00365 [Bacteroidales bacterium]|nr:hypothetical protein [Bacteroidales bacterium]
MRTSPLLIPLALLLVSCVQTYDLQETVTAPEQRKLGFDISVTREGEKVHPGRIATRSAVSGGTMVDASAITATMDINRPFSLIGIEKDSRSVLIDNTPVYSNSSGNYSLYLDNEILNIPSKVLLSAYYPHVRDLKYGEDHYTIPFSVSETEAGPLVSKTVERSINELNMLPLEFGHITNDIGFKICDITPREELQGLIHLRKLTAYHVASAGVYMNDLVLSRGNWSYQGYYRNVTVFEGDVPVEVGMANEKFVGHSTLVDRMAESSRFYAIPDEIAIGRQYVEVEFDVDGFYIGEEYYKPLPNQVYKYMIYGLLTNNEMVPGKQYTFHIGLDLSSIYKDITFTASIGEWETKIYENNDSF